MNHIRICSVPGLSNDYQHTIYFTDPDEQKSFFNSKTVKDFFDYTYTRKNWDLKVETNITVAESWNYLYFEAMTENGLLTGRRYYYFITDVTYISESTVKLSLEMDVLQTYFFDYNLQPCFVEREHSTTDGIGDNTVDEGLELGKLAVGSHVMPEALIHRDVLVMSTVNLLSDSFGDIEFVTQCDNVASGCTIYRVKGLTELSGLLIQLNDAGKLDGVVTMWEYPTALINAKFPDFATSNVSGTKDSITFTANRPSDLDGYTPKNNKLFTYPYCFLQANNNAGNNAEFRFERFEDTAFEFAIMGSVFPDGGVKIIPKNYNGIGFNYEESISLTGYPTIAWNTDSYKIWLAQNQNQNNLALATSAGSAIIGAGIGIAGAFMSNPLMIGSGISMAAGGAMGVFNQISQKADMEKVPPQSRGATSSTLNASTGTMGISFYQKTVSAERARILDDFFTMYGYATQRVKIPNRNARKSFTFTKTSNCHIFANICHADIQKIQSIYNNGVTFWQPSVTVGNYAADNAVK